jgi:hypothetical protein
MDTIREGLKEYVINISDDKRYSASVMFGHRGYLPIVYIVFTRNNDAWLDIVIMKNGYERGIHTLFYKNKIIDTMLYDRIAKILEDDIMKFSKTITDNKEGIISSEDIECLSSSIEEALRRWAKFDEGCDKRETKKSIMNSYINKTWKRMHNPYGGQSFIKYVDDYKIHLHYFKSAKIGLITISDKEYDLYRAFNIGFKSGFRYEVNDILWFFEKFMVPYVVRPSKETQDAMNEAFNKLPYRTDIICTDNDIRKGDFTWKE